MPPIHTADDYLKLSSSEQKKLFVKVAKGAMKDQQKVIQEYEKAIQEKKIVPVT